ncbi:MAG TPA: TetR/AcrR family transcriptional regulator [Rhizomicrobium sp.]|jgi:AcrR family transcriptional regulator
MDAPSGQRRWQRRKDARPQEILDAALSLFAEKGFAATRMDDIASRAGVTKGTIYLYFQSKEEVFKSLVRESIGTTLSSVIENAGAFEGSARALLKLVLRTVGRFMLTSDRIVLPKIVLAEAGNFPELVRFYRSEIIEKGLALLSSVFARGIASGEFRSDVKPEHAARLAIAPVLLAALWRTTFAPLEAEPYDLEGLIEAHLAVFLKGLEAA